MLPNTPQCSTLVQTVLKQRQTRIPKIILKLRQTSLIHKKIILLCLAKTKTYRNPGWFNNSKIVNTFRKRNPRKKQTERRLNRIWRQLITKSEKSTNWRKNVKFWLKLRTKNRTNIAETIRRIRNGLRLCSRMQFWILVTNWTGIRFPCQVITRIKMNAL